MAKSKRAVLTGVALGEAQARIEGYLAGRMGWEVTQCPYQGLAGEAWRAGWGAAARGDGKWGGDADAAIRG